MVTVKFTSDAVTLDKIISKSFQILPYQDYMIRYNRRLPHDNNKPPEALFQKNFLSRLFEHIEAGAHIIEANDYNAVAIWYPPNINFPEPRVEPGAPVFNEFDSQSHDMKLKYLEGRKYYYLNILARNFEQPAQKGVISALIIPYLQQAQEDKVPVMLEAVDEHAKEIYEHYGFQTVDVFYVGKGRVDSDNKPNANGSGIPCYFMLYNYC